MWTSFNNQLHAPAQGRALTSRNLLLFHFFVCSIGLIKACTFLARELYLPIASQFYIPYNEWAMHFLAPRKPQELICYCLFLLAALLYYGLVYIFAFIDSKAIGEPFCDFVRSSGAHLAIYVLGLFAVNAMALHFPIQSHLWILILFQWFLFALLPVFFIYWRFKGTLEQSFANRRWSSLQYVLLFLLALQMLAMWMPYLRGPLRMMNEFMDLPEETWMSDHYVENTSFINNHRIANLLKYSPDNDQGNTPPPRDGTYIHIQKTAPLVDFMEDQDNSSRSKSGLISARTNTSYYYNDKLGDLVVNRGMLFPEKERLDGVFADPTQKNLINTLFYSSNMVERTQNRRAYTLEERQFIKLNTFELHWQILNRWVTHHHNFVLGPINEYALGKPFKRINTQYGFLNIVLMKYLLEKTGGITYENYFRIWYFFWPLYYALFIAGCFLLMRDTRFVLITCLLAFSALQFINYKILFLGPGLNPIRHFVDVIIACVFYMYLRKNHKGLLACSFLLCLLAILNNTQFGYFIFGALLTTLVIRHICRRESFSVSEILMIGAALTAALFIPLETKLGSDYMLHYYLAGFASFLISQKVILAILGFLAVAGFILIWYYDRKKDLQDTALFLLLYSAASLIYWIWGATNNHWLNLAPILSISLVVLLKWGIDGTFLQKYSRSIASTLIVLLCAGLYMPSLACYYYSKYKYEKIFKDHKIYTWALDRAHFVSTANPRYFSNAIDLIRKFSAGRNDIYILSKYDNFLPFLASKYSSMPLPDVSWFLLSPTEVSLCVDTINQSQPEFLFVDRDINRSFNGEIVNEEDPFLSYLHDESLMRVQRLNELQKIYRAVANNYKPIASSELLMVLQRKAAIAP